MFKTHFKISVWLEHTPWTVAREVREIGKSRTFRG